MRDQKSSLSVLGLVLCASSLAAYACGSEAADGAAPHAELADSGSTTSFEGGGGADAQPDVGAVAETCGGAPCANHFGTKVFSEPGVPANAAALFGAAIEQPLGTNPALEPRIVYPNHETMFPINVSHIRHEWMKGGTNNLFRLVFAGPNTVVTVFTASTDWELTGEQWDWIAESNRGDSVKLTVSALDTASPTKAWVATSITLLYSAAEVEGAIYYWATGSKGVMKARVSDRTPEKFYTDPTAPDAVTCVACHTLSRDGKRLAVGYGGEKLKEVSVPARTSIVPSTGAPTRESGWTTFSPDGKRLLVASKGVLTLIDSDTGATVGAGDGVVPLGGKLATHPDWSSLGDKVAVSFGTKVGNKDVEGGSIAVIPYVGGTWGLPQIVVASSGPGDNNFFPVFSPDSKWIAYVNAAGKSKDAVTATLKLVPAAGGTPIELVRLNHRVNNADGVIDVGDSMPTWAPSTRAGVFWLAFSSLRAYASVRASDAKLDQIWIAAIDPSKPDPGYSAFWAPFQSLPEGNHRAFWTHVPGEKQCSCVERCGDGIDNDCDGVADEVDCQTCAAIDIAGNGKDDNCDCVIDNAPVAEICNDGIDNDGDGLMDGADPACAVR